MKHQLTGDEFDTLCRGLCGGEPAEPRAQAFAKLRAARLSRHLIQLLALRDSLAGFESLINLQKERPEAFTRALSRPLTGAWLAQCLRDPGPAGIGYLLDHIGHSRARRIRCEAAGMVLEVELDDADPFRHARGLQGRERLGDTDFARWEKSLHSAWEILATRHPGLAASVAATVDCLIPLVEEGSPIRMSASSHDAVGAILLQEQESERHLAATLVHESRHSILNALHDLFPLFEPSAKLVRSPWRTDPRPISGVLHGVHAFTGVAEFWRCEAAHDRAHRSAHESIPDRAHGAAHESVRDRAHGAAHDRAHGAAHESIPDRAHGAAQATAHLSTVDAAAEFEAVRDQVAQGREILRDEPSLTEAGRRVLAALQPMWDAWLTTVPGSRPR